MEDRDKEKDRAEAVGVPDEHPKVTKNVTQGCLNREIGKYKNKIPPEFQWFAEDKLVNKAAYSELKCQLPDSPRSTFLMVFSPDGKKVASTHGNHNVYVTDLTTGKNIQTLSGHPRTPWCIAFHPSSNQILASGCLAGQVRVWDLHGGSEVWTTESQSVIASLAFHPVDRMLVIATYNELHFWDWSQSKPFAKCSTKSEKEKVRYVSFDRLGHKLITGIANPVNTPSQWDRVSVVSTQPTVTSSSNTTTTAPSTTVVATPSTRQSLGRSIAFCDNYLMNQYSQLVRRYIDLSRSHTTRTTDRGTDPMDFVDVPRLGGLSDQSRQNSMVTSTHISGNRSIRYRIMRSTCRSYRPPSSRERFRIHSSLLSGLPSRSSPSSNSLVRATTTTTTASQNIISTTIAASSSSSMPQQFSRLRQCGFGFIARPVCLTFSRDNSSTSISVRASHPMPMLSSHSGAVTNSTYTPFSDRSVFSARETSSGETERESTPSIRPYRIVFDDINHIRASVHTLIRPSSEENENRNNPERRPNVISPLDRRDRQRSHLLDVEEVEIDRDFSRSFTYVSPFRRLSSDSESTSTTPTNNQRPSPQHWVSYNTNHLPLYPRPVPRFQVRPTFDMNNTSPVRRYRDNTDSETSANATPTVDVPSSIPTSSNSLSPVQINPGPVPRFQVRPRYLQDQSQLATSSESQSSGLQSNHILRRQFVLSRHSNSPFQPRVPHVVENSMLATTSTSSTSCRPEIPSCMSSFVASGASSGLRSATATSLPVENAGPSTSTATNSAATTDARDESVVHCNRDQRNRLQFFDHVKLLLRDRIRNSSEHASTDSTVNYSNIADESEGESRSTIDSSLEDGNTSSALGPRGLDPMLSSGSRNSDNTNDLPFFESNDSTSSSSSSTEPTLPFSRMVWDSDGDTIQYPSSPLGSFASDTAVSTQPGPSSEGTSQEQQSEENPNQDNEDDTSDSDTLSDGRDTPTETNFRHRIRVLSIHVENMQRLCRARIEIVQLQQIRKMWEDLTAEVRSFNSVMRSNSDSTQLTSESESRDPVNTMERLAISDNSPTPGTSSAQSSPQPSTSQSLSPQPSTSQSLSPQPSTSQSLSPQPSTSQPLSPQPSTSQPLSPQPSTSQPMSPQPSTSQPLSPQPSTSQPMSPQPSTSQPLSPQPSTSQSTHEDFCNRFKNIIESMVNTLLDDDDDDDDGQNSSSSPSRSRRESRQQRNETEEPQPGPSGLNRSSFPNKDYFKLRIFKSFKELINKTKKKRDARMGTQHLCQRHAARFRARRGSRQSQDSSPPRATSSLSSNLPSTSNGLGRSVSPPTPQPSTSKACNSSGQKKKSGKELLKQKRRLGDSAPGPESGVSSSKIMKSSVGGRSVTSTITTTAAASTSASTSAAAASTSASAAATSRSASTSTTSTTSTATTNDDATPSTSSGLPSIESTRELLRRMIQRMEAIVRFQREAFRRTEELSRNSRLRQTSSPDNSSDNSDSDDNSTYQDLYVWGIPGNCRVARSDIVQLSRAVAQLRTRRLLDHMVESLTELFQENSGNSDTELDEQIISLYTLLHLSLELTNLLLKKLNETSRDLERLWGLRNVTCQLGSRNTEASFSERSRNLRRVRERARGPTRSSVHPSFGPSREETRRAFQNPLLRSISRPRLCTNHNQSRNLGSHSSNHIYCRYRSTATFSTSYRRSRRAPPRISGAIPSGWWGFDDSPRRVSHLSRSREGPTGVILHGRIRSIDNNRSEVRGVRIWERRNSVDGESDFHRRFRSDNNNNNNSNLVRRGPNNDGNLNGPSSSNNDSSSNGNSSGSSGNNHSSNSLSFSAYLNLREQRPMFWIRYGTNSENNSSGGSESQSRENNFTVPVVHVNDIPVQDVPILNQPRYRPQSPTPRGPEDMLRWRTWRPRFLHPRYGGSNNYDDQDANDVPENIHYYRTGSSSGIYSLDPVIITDAPMSPHHRIQAWDFTKMKIPDISDREANGVVAECKIHNDASVDVSNDGHLLVTLLPSGRFSVTTMLGVYSLDWNTLGQLLYKTSFEQNAVSVSLSPTNRHLLVGLASRPLVLRDRINMAQIFKLEGARPSPPGNTWQSGRGRLVHVRDLEQTRETNIMSLNCIRWAPGAGQGLVYGTNTGQLKVLR